MVLILSEHFGRRSTDMNELKNIVRIFAVITLIFAFDSCEKDSGPDVRPLPIDTTHHVSFSREIQGIFDDRCIVCHNQAHPFLDLRISYSYNELMTTGSSAPYVDIQDPEQSIIYQHVKGETMAIMPPNGDPLTENQVALILLWIKQGAKNN